MEFVRKVRRDTSHEMQLCKSFIFHPRLPLLFCKFFQGIDKIFFISAARLGESAAASGVGELFMLKYFIVFRLHCQKYFQL